MKVVEVIDGLRSAGSRRRAGRAGPTHGPHAGARQGHARLHRQPCRSRHEYRRPARGAGGRGQLRPGRRHHARAGRFPHGPVRAAGPDRAGCVASGDGIHLPPVLRRGALPSLAHHRRAGRRPDRPQGRRRLLHLCRRPEAGAGRNARAGPAADPEDLGQPQASRRLCARHRAAGKAGRAADLRLHAGGRRAHHRHALRRGRVHRRLGAGPGSGPQRGPGHAARWTARSAAA